MASFIKVSRFKADLPTAAITCWPTLEGSLQASRIVENEIINFFKTSLVILGMCEPAGFTIFSYIEISCASLPFLSAQNVLLSFSWEIFVGSDRGQEWALICHLTLFHLNCHKVHPHIEIHLKKGLAELRIFFAFPSLSSIGLALRKEEEEKKTVQSWTALYWIEEQEQQTLWGSLRKDQKRPMTFRFLKIVSSTPRKGSWAEMAK